LTAPPGKHEDGDGLRLVVSKTGTRKWVFRYTHNGKRREMGLGRLKDVSLSNAREKAQDNRRLVLSGADPITHRNQNKTTEIPTFSECAERYIEAHKAGWDNAKHAAQWSSTLRTYVYPFFSDLPVNDINTENILNALSPIWNEKTETAKRVQSRIENILDWAAAMKYRQAENPARWRGHLNKLLVSPNKIKKVIHQPAMPYRLLPEFLLELSKHDSIASKALQFTILCAARTGEVIGANWGEIDMETCTWNIPAKRMKARRPHRVPLSDEALFVLDHMNKVCTGEYVFPGSRYGQPISNMAMLQQMRRMGYGSNVNKGDKSRGHYVPHGFRSTFRDWCAEQTSYPREVAEAALAHVNADKVEAAYQRGDLYEKREMLMQAWANYCVVQPDWNVVPILNPSS
jgi:integrase